jgi:hypothetical protein
MRAPLNIDAREAPKVSGEVELLKYLEQAP